MTNLEETILAQYANSPILTSYLESLNQAIDPVNIINSFYNNVWNITTAKEYGLDVWGRIVVVSRIVQLSSSVKNLGFEEATSVSADPFGQSPFFSGITPTSNFSLSDSAFRLLILVKALSNISNSSSKTYNTILMTLFPNRGNAYISSTDVMQSRLVFEFILQPFELAIIKQSGALSPPTGVNFDVMMLDLPFSFGFSEAGTACAAPFNQGTFFQGYA